MEQQALIKWSNLVDEINGKLVHVPNGGFRCFLEAAKFKRLGVRKGFPDLFLPIPRGGFHGLFIELKRKGSKPNDDQMNWLNYLESNGYAATWCEGWVMAKIVIEKYLKL